MAEEATSASAQPPNLAGDPSAEKGGDTAVEPPHRHPLWKTGLCSLFRPEAGADSCSHGDSCRFAHGDAELRPVPEKFRDRRSKKRHKPDSEAAADGEVVTLNETDLEKCVVGLPWKWSSDKLKTFFADQGISFKTAKKKHGDRVGFVHFENVEQVKNAVEILNGNTIDGKNIKVVDAVRKSIERKSVTGSSLDQRGHHTENHLGTDDPTPTSSILDENGDAVDEITSTVEGLVPKVRSVSDVVTPLAHMPYSDQLEHKKGSLLQILKKLTRNARKACPDAVPLPHWIIKSRDIGGLPCQLEGILESPLVNGYRNKCEFSVGYSSQNKCTVGFNLGNFREGVTAVEEPVNCPNVSRIACNFALIFQEFLQSSALPVWNRVDNTGFWRQFTVREGRTPSRVTMVETLETQVAEVMLIVQICSSNVDEEVMKNEFARMAQDLAQGAVECSPPLPLTAVVVQDHKGISNAAPSSCPLLVLPLSESEHHSYSEKPYISEARIHDYISNLCFSISPTAFFQVNTLAAERLYSLAGDWADLSPETLLFDVCCGTGTIGLTLAHRVGMVVGIEMNDSAVSDADRNAKLNGIKNCRFVCGKAEDVIGGLLKEYLDAPEQHYQVPNTSDVKSTDDDSNIAESGKDEEMELVDASVSPKLARSSSLERISTCSDGKAKMDMEILSASEEKSCQSAIVGESLVDCIAKYVANDSIVEEDPGHEIINNSFRFLKGCTTQCRESNQENSKYQPAGQENGSSEDTDQTNPSPTQQFKDIVAIVDPPRVGLHPVVIKALRTHPRIRRLVYISCNPESLVANAIELCTPTTDNSGKGKGNRAWRSMSSAGLARNRVKSMPNSEPFQPVRSMAVDLFPHTPHCEMVMLFER